MRLSFCGAVDNSVFPFNVYTEELIDAPRGDIKNM